MSSANKGQGRELSFSKGGLANQYACSPSGVPMVLETEPLHVIYASMLENASQKLDCSFISGENDKKSSLQLTIKNGVLSIGKYTYNIARMNETLNIKKNWPKEFKYFISDGGTDGKAEFVELYLDEVGKVSTVIRHGKDSIMVFCHVTNWG